MLVPQSTTSTVTNRFSLIDRVLNLRRSLGIDVPLSISDPEDISLAPIETHASSMETLEYTSAAYDSRDWLVWSQSPGGENAPEKDHV